MWCVLNGAQCYASVQFLKVIHCLQSRKVIESTVHYFQRSDIPTPGEVGTLLGLFLKLVVSCLQWVED